MPIRHKIKIHSKAFFFNAYTDLIDLLGFCPYLAGADQFNQCNHARWPTKPHIKVPTACGNQALMDNLSWPLAKPE